MSLDFHLAGIVDGFNVLCPAVNLEVIVIDLLVFPRGLSTMHEQEQKDLTHAETMATCSASFVASLVLSKAIFRSTFDHQFLWDPHKMMPSGSVVGT